MSPIVPDEILAATRLTEAEMPQAMTVMLFEGKERASARASQW
ncbi:MAG: hypothetical protein ACPGVO_08010 [Spirulinaceae cyanobacterium]